MSSTAQPTRVQKLDSIRGIAALMVVLGHCGGLTFVAADRIWPLQILWDGVDAVAMFFVLSGYVLALQLSTHKVSTYTGFVVRRFFRIWPPFAVVIVATAVLFYAVTPSLPAHSTLETPFISPQTIFDNLLMARSAMAIDPPVWSLFIEIRISLIFPLIFLLVVRANLFVAVGLGLAYSIIASRLVHSPSGLAVEFANTSKMVYLFVIGAALAIPGNPILRIITGRPPLVFALFLASIALISYRFAPWALPLKNYVPAIGIVLLFVVCLESTTAAKLLNRPTFLFLGRISYGVYLLHYPILISVLSIAALSQPVVIPIVVASSVLLAWALNVAVEQPMISIGRKLGARSAHPQRIQSVPL